MNVLLLTSQLQDGGAETHVLSLASQLAHMGYGVTVASSGGRLVSHLGEMGVSHVTLPLNKKKPTALFKSYLGISRLLSTGNYRIAHAHSRIAAVVAWWVCSKRRHRGVCLITTIHAHYKARGLYCKMSRWGRGVIAVSDDLRMHLLSTCSDVLPENVTVIPNGIDASLFIPRGEKTDKKIRIAFLSRLDDDCSAAAYALCRIAVKLFERHGNLEIIIGGGGSQYRRLRQMADGVNRAVGAELIRCVGQVDDTVVFHKSADIFVGVSRAALEAMCCAVPVVLAGDEGYLGILAENKISVASGTNFCCRGCGGIEDNALFEDIERLLDMSEDERCALGLRLREYALIAHSQENTAKQTARFYRKMLKSQDEGNESVLLCGYYGYGNMGDELLLSSAISRASARYPRRRIVALTAHGGRDGRRFGIRCVRRFSPIAVVRAIKRCRVVIFGGGTLLQNKTSRRSLGYYLLILRLAKRYSKRVELWANGIGEIYGERARRMTAKALSACDHIGMRERESAFIARELLLEYGFTPPRIELEEDLVIGYATEDGGRGEYILDHLGVLENSRTAVVALRGIERKGYMKSLERWLTRLVSDGIKLVFVAMYPNEDMEVCRRVCREYGGVLAYPVSASDVISLMKRSCLVCGMRYHALVLAHIAGVPFIGFGGESKIQSFCRSHGGVYYTDIEQ